MSPWPAKFYLNCRLHSSDLLANIARLSVERASKFLQATENFSNNAVCRNAS